MVREQFGMPLPQPIQQAVELHSTMIGDGAPLDFCITVLGCTHTLPEHWQPVTDLIWQCFWHIAFEVICVALERDFKH